MKKITFAALAAALAIAACTSTNPYTGERRASNTTRGAAAGALIGGAIGALTNTSSGKQAAKNAMIGAGIGALAGGAVGAYMDRQAEELRRELEGTGVRVVRNPDNTITLVMPSNITFAVNEYSVRPEFYGVLNSVGKVFDKYERTYVSIAGHTDSTGTDDYNYRLSQDRANAVAAYLIENAGLLPERFIVNGYGEAYPIADNSTDYGRAQNRRVEIKIEPLTN